MEGGEEEEGGGVCGVPSLGLVPDLRLCLLLAGCRLRFWFWQPRDVKHEADAQVELSEDRPQLGDQVELHDLTQKRVVPGRMHLELWKETERVRHTCL